MRRRRRLLIHVLIAVLGVGILLGILLAAYTGQGSQEREGGAQQALEQAYTAARDSANANRRGRGATVSEAWADAAAHGDAW